MKNEHEDIIGDQTKMQAQKWMISYQYNADIQNLNKLIIMKQCYNLGIFYYSTQSTSLSWTYCSYRDVSAACTVNNETYCRWLSYANHYS